jgi:sulfate transporter 3
MIHACFLFRNHDFNLFNCRLGFIVDFLSHATIVGFMGGAATVVCLQQLKGILGLVRFTHGTDLVSVMRSVFSQAHQVHISC